QLREEMTGKTDLCQLAVHDHLGLTKIAPKGKGLVLLQPEQKNQKERDGQRFTVISAQLLCQHTVKPTVAFHESQAGNRHKIILSINLRRKQSSTSFCRNRKT